MRPTSVNTLKVNKDYLHIKQKRARDQASPIPAPVPHRGGPLERLHGRVGHELHRPSRTNCFCCGLFSRPGTSSGPTGLDGPGREGLLAGEVASPVLGVSNRRLPVTLLSRSSMANRECGCAEDNAAVHRREYRRCHRVHAGGRRDGDVDDLRRALASVRRALLESPIFGVRRGHGLGRDQSHSESAALTRSTRQRCPPVAG